MSIIGASLDACGVLRTARGRLCKSPTLHTVLTAELGGRTPFKARLMLGPGEGQSPVRRVASGRLTSESEEGGQDRIDAFEKFRRGTATGRRAN